MVAPMSGQLYQIMSLSATRLRLTGFRRRTRAPAVTLQAMFVFYGMGREMRLVLLSELFMASGLMISSSLPQITRPIRAGALTPKASILIWTRTGTLVRNLAGKALV